MLFQKIILRSFIPLLASSFFVNAGEEAFLELVEKVENDVLELAAMVTDLYKDRCTTALNDCSKNNFHECVSSFPDQTCPGGEQLGDKKCGDDVTCSRLWDYSISRVSLPEKVADGQHENPTDPEVIETICFSRKLDEWFKNKHEKEKPFWDQYALEIPPMYFGAHNGAFRIYPAYRSSDCGAFDPTKRPWYIGGSSGNKNLLLILDVSGSMNGEKIETMKLAAERIVETLNVGDRIAIIPFSDDANQTIADDGTYMYVASEVNKNILIDELKKLSAGGATNFRAGFRRAYEIFNNTYKKEFHVDCNSAVLFLTDGKMTAGGTKEDVMSFIIDGIEDMEQKTGHTVSLFTYSIGSAETDEIPYELSCSVNTGVWSKIEDELQILDSLTSYYTLFSLGLGTDKNQNFTAWVEPYLYADGVSVGTTVSAPVYDTSKTPHLFLGVVGLDLRLAAIDIALGVDKGSTDTLDRVIRRSTAKCPTLDNTLCELESFRRRGSAGAAAMCTNSCSDEDFVDIEPEKCPAIDDYPTDLWDNFDEEGLSYEDTACCIVGTTSASEVCPVIETKMPVKDTSSSSKTGLWIGIGVGAMVIAAGVICIVKKKRAPPPASTTTNSSKAQDETNENSKNDYYHVKLSVIPPPKNPDYQVSAPTEG
eukprot:CAMPEP_0195285320 /NCGR_PEP_ID=MMETSP0707-20130614/3194_1 /TAXON_ID=33640 /ORGANISM="Asterionellopsis glacialis, Strain CCMP134" /LENGTH=649 /DNA_ID=CAMNT_0040344793 /DNA_START=91 /DNA_END=2040 /DNA_ORIENTATION=+